MSYETFPLDRNDGHKHKYTGNGQKNRDESLPARRRAKGSTVPGSVAVPDPDPPDPHVFEHLGSGSTSQRYGYGSFYHHAKIVRKTLIPTIL